MDDTCHLEGLAWAVYNGPLLVGARPKLPGDHPWCTVLAGLHKHIYWGHDDVAHCLPHMLGSWDCQEWIEALRRGSRLSSTQSRWRRASQPRRRSQSSLRCHSETLAWGNRDGHSCGSSPPYTFEVSPWSDCTPCTPSRSHRGVTAFLDASSMPKLASVVNVPSHAQSSPSSEGMARASLDDDDA